MLIFAGVAFAQEPPQPHVVGPTQIDENGNRIIAIIPADQQTESQVYGMPGSARTIYGPDQTNPYPTDTYSETTTTHGKFNLFGSDSGYYGSPGSLASPEQGSRASSEFPGGVRDGMFQKFYFSGLWSPTGGDNNFGITQLDLNAMFAFPFFQKESPLLITPGFSVWFFDWKENGQKFSKDLFSANCEFRILKPLGSRYTLDIAATPGIYSDFKQSSDKGFRVPAHLGIIWNTNPRTKIVLGCAYLDRADYNWLPFGGIIWTPDDLDMTFELLFPRPKISKRIRWWGAAAGDDVSDWLYVAGEFAGGSWAIQNDWLDMETEFAYRDFRALIGYERKAVGRINFAVEAGGMFARKYHSSLYDRDESVDPSFFIRIKAVY